jgi:hypothetical protein
MLRPIAFIAFPLCLLTHQQILEGVALSWELEDSPETASGPRLLMLECWCHRYYITVLFVVAYCWYISKSYCLPTSVWCEQD